MFPPGSYTFRPTKDGLWKFVLWGPGGAGTGGQAGGSGAYVEITKRLTMATGDVVQLVVGAPGGVTDTTATFRDGTVATAGHGIDGNSGGAGGTASVVAYGFNPGAREAGSDPVTLNGSTGAAAGAGTGGGQAAAGAPGAPGVLPFRGGAGGASSSAGGSPGGGGNLVAQIGGSGLAIAYLVR